MLDFSVGQRHPNLSLNEVIKKQPIPSSTDLMADKSALPRSFQLTALMAEKSLCQRTPE